MNIDPGSEYQDRDGSWHKFDPARLRPSSEPSDVFTHIDRIADEAGLQVMDSDGILGILHDRESVSEDRLLALTPKDVTEFYENYVGPAVDQIEFDLTPTDWRNKNDH